MKKTYSIYHKLALLLILAISLTSCKDDFVKGLYLASNNEYFLNVQTSSFEEVPATGGTVDMEIQATEATEWNIVGLSDWIHASSLSGKGSQEISFRIDPYESLYGSRTHIFSVETKNTGWSMSFPVAITQLPEEKYFNISDQSLIFDAEGGSKELMVKTNVNWKAECEADFVTLSQDSNYGDGSLKVSLLPYKSMDIFHNRKAEIYFRDAEDEDLMAVVSIAQTPVKTSVSTEKFNIEFGRTADSRSYVFGEVDGGYRVTTSDPWLSITKNSEKVIDITISAMANLNDETRSAQAYVTFDNSDVAKYIFTVKQSGCSISIDPVSLQFEVDGGSKNIAVKSDSPWTTINMSDWVKVTKYNESCSITVEENNSLDTRIGTVYFTRLDEANQPIGRKVELSITQQPRKISTDNEILMFGPEPSSRYLNIETDANWTLTSSEDWITVNKSEGFGSASVEVSVKENESSSSRNGTLFLKSLGKTIEISIVQSTYFINTSATAINISPTGGYATVSLHSNVSWSAESSESWLTVSPESGIGEATIRLSAPSNTSGNDRNAVVTINSQLGEIKIYVQQLFYKPTISVSPSTLTFEAKGGSSTVQVNASESFSVKVSDSWLSYRQSGSSVVITAAENNKSTTRNGYVTFSLDGSSESASVIVTQLFEEPPANPSVSLTSVTSYNWAYTVVAKVVANGNQISEAGIIWNTGNSSYINEPTLNSYDGKKVATLNGTTFEATTPQIYDHHVKIRAYVKVGNKVYYSDSRLM